MADTIETSRDFVAQNSKGESISLRVRKPNYKETLETDFEQSRVFNAALLAGLPTRARQVNQMKAAGHWSDQQDRDMEKAREEVLALRKQLEAFDSKPDTDPDKKALLEKHEDAFRRFDAPAREIEALLAHTAESKADRASRNFIMSKTIELSTTGKPLWPAVDVMMNSTDMVLFRRVFYEFSQLQQNVASNWERDSKLMQDPAEETAAEPAPAVQSSGADGGEKQPQPEVAKEAPAVAAEPAATPDVVLAEATEATAA